MKIKLHYLKSKDGRFVRLSTGQPFVRAYLVPAYRGAPSFSRTEFSEDVMARVQADLGQTNEIEACEIEVEL